MANALPQLEFVPALKLAYSRIKDMTGRSRRSEFWWAILAVGVAGFILSLIPKIGPIFQFAAWVVAAPLMIRRLHDTGKGPNLVYAYLIIAALVMIMGLIIRFNPLTIFGVVGVLTTLCSIAWGVIGIILIVFCVQDSEPKTNQYGPSPKYPEGPENPTPENPAQ